MPLLLDLFCGRLGWSKAFLARGWDCMGIDLVEPPDKPKGFLFEQRDILKVEHICSPSWNALYGKPDFICASSPCEEFSVHGMKHFHPNPKYPEMGIKLFNHTRALCESSGVPYVMENVRAAQEFVGRAVHHAGPFYLWGNGIPTLMPQGITKGIHIGSSKRIRGMSPVERKDYRKSFPVLQVGSASEARKHHTAHVATIPLLLAHCIADHAERLLELRATV